MLKNPSTKYRAAKSIGLTDRTWPNATITRAPIWCSVDMRDGNQALIEPMDIPRKLKMFEQLVKIGFKEIEVGFPSASQIEFDFLRKLIDENRIPDDVTIQVLTQARPELIERTFESLVGVPRVIVHLYNATAPVMRRVVLNMSEDEIVQLAVDHAQMFKDLAAKQPATDWTFEYSPEMYSDTELAFSARVIDAVTAVWEPTPAKKCIINLPTTVECCTSNVFADMVEWTGRHIARRDAIVLSIHPHNDRGTGTATAELALLAGADRLEGCLFGNGERTGNLDVVNVALNMYSQGVSPELDFSDIDAIRSTVEYCNQLPVHPRHPYVGDLVYTSFSGSHQDAIKKAFGARKDGDVWEMPYLPIDPKDVGRSYEAVIRVNSQSGKGGISYLLESEYGLQLPRRLQIEFSQAVQRAMDATGKEFTAKDLWGIFEREYGLNAGSKVEYQLATKGEVTEISGTVSVIDQSWSVKGQGAGPIDAWVQGVGEAMGRSIRVLDYTEHAIGQGADAKAVAYVEMRVDDAHTVYGVAMDANIVTASLRAIVSGVNRVPAVNTSPAHETAAS
ncbi:2-isopropylmalate synthase [Comamonas serinivorans]|uniref:2-isopropylmalate synthase n=1 Tax=Comamonas serinivorans TaxID=1082851 RepID=A0A1Y0EP59_9BURK|nr:2-isopropylmalate synthase [Comamonas serinivorans]ARU05424.1 2-isopropylmalate synthase [Comamonas serinivorans]